MSREKRLRAAVKLREDFTGERADRIDSVPKPVVPDEALAIGDVIGIIYETSRDGRKEKYIHQFAKGARPLLIASYDGRQLFMLGGAYDFTARGIVDRRRKR